MSQSMDDARNALSKYALNGGPANSIAKVRYTHDAMIDTIIAHPEVSQGELAKMFGFTESWVSRVMGSDAFRNRLADRKAEIVDPAILLGVEEKLRALAHRSLDVMMKKLENDVSLDFGDVTKAVEISSRALGYGAGKKETNNTVNFVVTLPEKVQDAGDWAAANGGTIIDVTPEGE